MKKTESKKTETKKAETKKAETKKAETKKPTAGTKGHFGTVVPVHLPQDTEQTIIPYLNKKETKSVKKIL